MNDGDTAADHSCHAQSGVVPIHTHTIHPPSFDQQTTAHEKAVLSAKGAARRLLPSMSLTTLPFRPSRRSPETTRCFVSTLYPQQSKVESGRRPDAAEAV